MLKAHHKDRKQSPAPLSRFIPTALQKKWAFKKIFLCKIQLSESEIIKSYLQFPNNRHENYSSNNQIEDKDGYATDCLYGQCTLEAITFSFHVLLIHARPHAWKK